MRVLNSHCLLGILVVAGASCVACADDNPPSVLELDVTATVCLTEGGCEDVPLPRAKVTAEIGGDRQEKTTDAKGFVSFEFTSVGRVKVSVDPSSWKLAPVEHSMILQAGVRQEGIRVATIDGAVSED